jgi:ssDNA-binding Zn-finger/Zn-ribbon topoisomerase 1
MGDAADMVLDQMFDEELFDLRQDYYLCHSSRRRRVYGSGNCPNCSKPTVLRVSKTNNKFYGCSDFPNCRGTREYIPVDQELTVKVMKTAKILVHEDGIHCGQRCPERGCTEGPYGGEHPGCVFFECRVEKDNVDWIRCPRCLKAKDLPKGER